MNAQFQELLLRSYRPGSFTFLSGGFLDFTTGICMTQNVFLKPGTLKFQIDLRTNFYFDLASLTKPLLLGMDYFFSHRDYSETEKQLLNHTAGIPATAKLSQFNFNELLRSLPVNLNSATCYSDLSYLKLWQLRKAKTDFSNIIHAYPRDLFYHLHPREGVFAPTGWREGKIVCGEVHDLNAFVIGKLGIETPHAGLFGTSKAVLDFFLKMEQEYRLLDFLSKEWAASDISQRFVAGFDRVQDLNNSLAGINLQGRILGHLGFTGTAFFIHLDLKRIGVLLTNESMFRATHRHHLNNLRKHFFQQVWDYGRT